MADFSSGSSRSPQPETSVCIFAPPISSRVTFSPMTSSAIRGEPRYIEALPSTMNTTSQNAGMYAPPAAHGPNRQHTCGILPARLDLVVEDLPGAPAAGEQVDLVGDPRAGRVDQVDDRALVLPGQLDDPDDLLDRPRAPRARLDGRSRWP